MNHTGTPVPVAASGPAAASSLGKLPRTRRAASESSAPIDERLDQLEQAWEQSVLTFGQLATYLHGVHPAQHSQLLRHLIAVDLEIRRGRGLDPQPADYLEVFPHAMDAVEGSFRACAKPPPMIGQYRLERLLGAGGFASVYLARDTQLDRHVAVKIPHPEGISRAGALEALRQEAQTAVALNHPGIVRVLHVDSEVTVPLAIVMEYVEGPTLQHWMHERAEGRADIRQVSHLIAVIADSLAYAHRDDDVTSRPGLIHRDVKPGNILLQRITASNDVQQGLPPDPSIVQLGGAAYRPRLSDFGLAVNEVTQRCQRGVIAGSLPYLSPEQTRGETHLLRSFSDVWSLGVIFYELLTGRLPFQGDGLQETLEEIQTRTPRPIRELHAGVPVDLERLCLSCLAKEAVNRPTARDVAMELRAWLESLEGRLDPTGVSPSSHAYASKRSWRTSAVLCSSAVLTGLLLAVLGSSYRHPLRSDSVISYVDRADPDPSDYMPDHETLSMPPKVPPEDVHLTIQNQTRHEIEVSMTNCSIFSAATDPDYDPFERPYNGARFRMRLQPGEAVERPYLSGSGWYVFFVRRIDGDWYPFRHMSRDIGARNVSTSPYILLEISEGNEEGVPYEWNFEDSSEPLPDFDPPANGEV